MWFLTILIQLYSAPHAAGARCVSSPSTPPRPVFIFLNDFMYESMFSWVFSYVTRNLVTPSSVRKVEAAWECNICTLLNNPSCLACEVCESPRSPTRAPRKGTLRARYELRGVLHHIGQNAEEGHYFTDVREALPRGGRCGKAGRAATAAERGSVVGGWKRHDDSIVTPVSEAEVLDGPARRTCYICFYSLVE